MEVDLQTCLPGGPSFSDVSTVFTDAAKDLGPGELVFADGVSLQDAMSAFEIGEPRLDSGCILEDDRKPPFDPLAPLLPQELCWILDRSCTCEMEWHAGNTLSQTVFTFLFVHHLDDIDQDFVVDGRPARKEDASRPLELITLVLRSAVFGLLKCCDLSWRELMRGRLQDGEDMHADKCDISLLERQSVRSVLAMLDDAVYWLSNFSEIPKALRDALVTRLLFRKTLLELLDLRIHKNHSKFTALIATARALLKAVRADPSAEPAPDSPAALCFDPLVARKLNAFIPFRRLQLRDLSRTWDAVDAILDGWDELAALGVTARVSNWVIAGNLRVWLPGSLQIPYIRSSIQGAFSDGSTILNNYSLVWIVDRFFSETLGISYDSLVKAITARWEGEDSPPFEELERQIIELVTSHVKGLWYNPPRRRRHLMKSLLQWHALYDMLLKITSSLASNNEPAIATLLDHIYNVALIWRFSVIRDVIFSGFQLELYSAEEKSFAYWYASRVIKAHLAIVSELLLVAEEGSEANVELQFQREFLFALRIMCTAMFAVTVHTPCRGQQSKSNFLRRYKWAFRLEYADIDTPVVAQPQLEQFLEARIECSMDELYSPSDSIRLAREILLQLIESSPDWAGLWTGGVVRLLHILAESCEQLSTLPANMKDVSAFDISRLKWDPQKNPWFPVGCEDH